MLRILILSSIFFSAHANALGWSYVGSGFSLLPNGAVESNRSDSRILIFAVSSPIQGKQEEQNCYELELTSRPQEGTLYCEKSGNSPLSESIFSRAAASGDNKKFKCIKNCRAKTPKTLHLQYDQPD